MLVVDVGNTRSRLARVVPGPDGALVVSRLGERPSEAPDAVLAAVREHLAAPDDPVAIASVVPSVGEILLEQLPGARPADHRSPLPFGLALDAPAATGADRFCNMAEAAARGWRDALVVDAGTATTFDVLEEGVFVGGLIAPGIGLAAEALGSRAARLRPVPVEPAPAAPRADTTGALSAGSYLTGVHGVLGTIAALQAEAPTRPVVLTGGLAGLLGPLGDVAWTRDADWTLKGAYRLAAGPLGA